MAKSSEKNVQPLQAVTRYSSIEGAITSEPDLGDLNDGDKLYETGLLFKFKKQYGHATEYLEKAYKIHLKSKHFLGAIQCLIELAWLKYNHEEKDGVAKANRIFSEVQTMISAHINEPGVNDTRARLLHYRGLVKYREGKFGEGVKLFKHARTFCRQDDLEAAKINDSLGIHYERVGDFHRAIQCLKDSLVLKRKCGPLYEQAITSQILGKLYIRKEEYDKALEALEFSLNISDSLEDHRRVSSIRNELIRLYLYQHEFERAREMIDLADKETRLRDFHDAHGMAMFYRAYLHHINREYEQCRGILQRSVTPVFKKYKFNKGLGMAHRLQASVEHHTGNSTHALEVMGEAISVFRKEKMMDEVVKTHFELGKIYLDMGDRKLALASMLECLKLIEQNGLFHLASYVEDELFRIDEQQWQDIVDKRTRHERIFEKEHTLLEALSALSNATPGEGGDAADDISTQTNSLISLLHVGQAMAAERDVDSLLTIIKEETERALDADRCTVFLYDRDKNELWSKVASGLDNAEEIRFPAHLGLAGYVAKTGETLNIKNAYEDPRFNKDVDRKTGYKTHNLLCMPMRNRKMEIIGVFQVLNKRNSSFEKVDEDLLMAISASAGVAIENAKLAQDQRTGFESFIKTLSSTIDARDPITAGHSERVAEYSLLLGEQMQMVNEDLEALKYASLLHDIGKIGIREDILVKDGRLTEKEYRHIQKHAYYTYEILKNIHFERHLRDVPEIAASHHEKMDGTGYFRGLSGMAIPLSGRILAISDVFDAITSRRHYRNRMPFDKVLGILKRDAGGHFDPDCVDAFFNVSLYQLAHVLVKEKWADYNEQGLLLLKSLERNITLREYNSILNKEKMTKAEADIHRAFSTIYHHNHMSDLD